MALLTIVTTKLLSLNAPRDLDEATQMELVTLMKESKLFEQEVSDELCVKILQFADCVQMDENSVLAVQSRPGKDFFMLLSGEVGIVRSQDSSTTLLLGNPARSDHLMKPLKGGALIQFLGKKVASLVAPASFGEQSVLTGARRIASIVCASPCTLLVVPQALYTATLAKVHALRLQMGQKVAALQSLDLCRGWGEQRLMQVAYYLRPQRYGAGELLCAQGRRCPGALLLTEGEVAVTEEVKYETNGNHEVSRLTEKDRKILKKGHQVPFEVVTVPVCTMRKGCIIGDTEIAQQQRNWARTVTAACETLIFFIPMDIFSIHFVNTVNAHGLLNRTAQALQAQVKRNEAQYQSVVARKVKDHIAGSKVKERVPGATYLKRDARHKALSSSLEWSTMDSIEEVKEREELSITGRIKKVLQTSVEPPPPRLKKCINVVAAANKIMSGTKQKAKGDTSLIYNSIMQCNSDPELVKKKSGQNHQLYSDESASPPLAPFCSVQALSPTSNPRGTGKKEDTTKEPATGPVVPPSLVKLPPAGNPFDRHTPRRAAGLAPMGRPSATPTPRGRWGSGRDSWCSLRDGSISPDLGSARSSPALQMNRSSSPTSRTRWPPRSRDISGAVVLENTPLAPLSVDRPHLTGWAGQNTTSAEITVGLVSPSALQSLKKNRGKVDLLLSNRKARSRFGTAPSVLTSNPEHNEEGGNRPSKSLLSMEDLTQREDAETDLSPTSGMPGSRSSLKVPPVMLDDPKISIPQKQGTYVIDFQSRQTNFPGNSHKTKVSGLTAPKQVDLELERPKVDILGPLLGKRCSPQPRPLVRNTCEINAKSMEDKLQPPIFLEPGTPELPPSKALWLASFGAAKWGNSAKSDRKGKKPSSQSTIMETTEDSCPPENGRQDSTDHHTQCLDSFDQQVIIEEQKGVSSDHPDDLLPISRGSFGSWSGQPVLETNYEQSILQLNSARVYEQHRFKEIPRNSVGRRHEYFNFVQAAQLVDMKKLCEFSHFQSCPTLTLDRKGPQDELLKSVTGPRTAQSCIDPTNQKRAIENGCHSMSSMLKACTPSRGVSAAHERAEKTTKWGNTSAPSWRDNDGLNTRAARAEETSGADPSCPVVEQCGSSGGGFMALQGTEFLPARPLELEGDTTTSKSNGDSSHGGGVGVLVSLPVKVGGKVVELKHHCSQHPRSSAHLFLQDQGVQVDSEEGRLSINAITAAIERLLKEKAKEEEQIEKKNRPHLKSTALTVMACQKLLKASDILKKAVPNQQRIHHSLLLGSNGSTLLLPGAGKQQPPGHQTTMPVVDDDSSSPYVIYNCTSEIPNDGEGEVEDGSYRREGEEEKEEKKEDSWRQKKLDKTSYPCCCNEDGDTICSNSSSSCCYYVVEKTKKDSEEKTGNIIITKK